MCKPIFIICGFVIILYIADYVFNQNEETLDKWSQLVDSMPQKIFTAEDIRQNRVEHRNLKCHFASSECFDVYKCGGNNGKLKGI